MPFSMACGHEALRTIRATRHGNLSSPERGERSYSVLQNDCQIRDCGRGRNRVDVSIPDRHGYAVDRSHARG
jgi:hypothetical protein